LASQYLVGRLDDDFIYYEYSGTYSEPGIYLSSILIIHCERLYQIPYYFFSKREPGAGGDCRVQLVGGPLWCLPSRRIQPQKACLDVQAAEIGKSL